MITQKHIAHILGCSRSSVNFIIKKKRPVSWPIAEKMAELFPAKNIQQWKKATPEEFHAAFKGVRLS